MPDAPDSPAAAALRNVQAAGMEHEAKALADLIAEQGAEIQRLQLRLIAKAEDHFEAIAEAIRVNAHDVLCCPERDECNKDDLLVTAWTNNRVSWVEGTPEALAQVAVDTLRDGGAG